MTTDIQMKVLHAFEQEYGAPATHWVRAPGRVNLIGEHTDYNDGFVLPMAIDRAVYVALKPNDLGVLRLTFLDYDSRATLSLTHFVREKPTPAEYVKGVAAMLVQDGHALKGFDGVILGDVPIGAGLSSSAALEMATARALSAVSDIPWDAPTMARVGQRTENDWLGLKTGIMDQMISAAGQAGSALLIDCRTLEVKAAPLPSGTVAIILDTGTRRGLVHSAYNERRTQCETAARYFGVTALRDVTVDQFQAGSSGLDELSRRRARHVVTENARTLAAFDAMHADDSRVLGALIDASHDSLRDDFEVSTDALNTMVELARRHPGCLGARMTGAGFGGCAVALVRWETSDDFADFVTPRYREATGHSPALYVCTASEGASVETL